MVRLALLWHMHQPYYEDLATREHILPWVRLHATKDYWGMVSVLDEFPDVRVTFNLVPSLLVQVEAFAKDQANDRHLQMGLKPANELTADEAAWTIANGFHAPYGRMIAPFARYRDLHAAKHAGHPFDVDALRDLQVWHKLVWMDPDLLSRDRRLVSLIEKGSGYSEHDKAVLRTVELEILGNVIPAYRRAAERGQIELSSSPFYHPILPLLCDSDVHLRAHPTALRLEPRFKRPDDARLQVRRALDYHASIFGQPARGMWPSEGSVSDEVVALLAQEGVRWIATDEDILARSLTVGLPRDAMGHAQRPDVLYRAYQVGDEAHSVGCLFRDHSLSDRIGFTYQGWDADPAAIDFLDRVREAGRRFAAATGEDGGIVSVILDGENAWEHYAGGGRPFLRALYGKLQRASDIETVTMTEASSRPTGHLQSIFPGSWINSDFWIWIGHQDDQRAWGQLANARKEFNRRAASLSPEARERALVELLIAEGSDWFWWYGDDHSSDHDQDFDELFRRQLRNAYQALGVNPPADLYETNITTNDTASEPRLKVGLSEAPVLDGRDTSALEWASAVRAPLKAAGGAMHQVSGGSLVCDVLVLVSESGLNLRLAGERLARLVADQRAELAVLIADPDARTIDVQRSWLAVDRVVEIQVPWSALGGDSRMWTGRFAIAISDAGDRIQERHPADGYWVLAGPVRRPAWSV